MGEFRFNIALPAPAVAPKTGISPKAKVPTPADKARAELPALRQGVVERPEDGGAWHQLGNALIGARELEEAAEVLGRAVELAPGSFAPQFDLGVVHGELGRHREAEKVFSGIVEADPELTHAHSHLGLVAMQNLAIARSKQGRAAEALATLKPAAKMAWQILAELGSYAMDADRHAEALDYFFAAMSFGPPSEDVLHGLGRSLLRVGRNAEAETWLRNAIAVDAACLGAHYDLGLAQARQGKRREARRAFRSALRLNARHAWSWYDLGCLDALDRKPDAAFRKLRRAAHLGLNNVAHANADRDLVRLRRDPRWPALVAEMGRSGAKSSSEAS